MHPSCRRQLETFTLATVEERQPAKVLTINTGHIYKYSKYAIDIAAVVAECVLCPLDIPVKFSLPLIVDQKW